MKRIDIEKEIRFADSNFEAEGGHPKYFGANGYEEKFRAEADELADELLGSRFGADADEEDYGYDDEEYGYEDDEYGYEDDEYGYEDYGYEDEEYGYSSVRGLPVVNGVPERDPTIGLIPFVFNVVNSSDTEDSIISMFWYTKYGDVGYSATGGNISLTSGNADINKGEIFSQIATEPITLGYMLFESSNEGNTNQIVTFVRHDATGVSDKVPIPMRRNPKFFVAYSEQRFQGNAIILDRKTEFKFSVLRASSLRVWLYYSNKATLSNQLVGGSTLVKPVGLPNTAPALPWMKGQPSVAPRPGFRPGFRPRFRPRFRIGRGF